MCERRRREPKFGAPLDQKAGYAPVNAILKHKSKKGWPNKITSGEGQITAKLFLKYFSYSIDAGL